MDLFERFRSGYPFPLDDFQVQAVRAIEAGQSVIVSAPTGAGKTLVAEFAIHAALGAKRRLAYTTPLKALSNQKFADFTRAFGADTVGILTGDVKVNPHAPVLVMTTEILRNALYGSGLDGLRYIVLDECHYMGDEGRGTVWEEIIVSAPADVVLVGLSATVANVKEIADWISIVHRPIVPIYHPHRPVPLAYVIADLAGEIHELAAVRGGRAQVDRRRAPRPGRSRALVHAARRPPDRPHRGAGGAGLAAGHLLHLQPGRLRARDAGRPHRGQEPAGGAAAAGGGHGDRRADPREPHRRRVHAEPERVRGAAARDRAAPRRHPAERQAAHRGALRARPLQGRVRDGDDVPRHPHAGAVGRAPGPHQADRPRLPRALAQRADADGGPGRAPRDRSRGHVRRRPRRPRRARRHPARDRRLARADREPVQARLRLGGAPALDRRRARGLAPADRVVVRAVPEPQAHPRGRERRREARALRSRRSGATPAPCGDFQRIGRYRRARHEVEVAPPGARARRRRVAASARSWRPSRGGWCWSGGAARRPSPWCSGSTRFVVTACSSTRCCRTERRCG